MRKKAHIKLVSVVMEAVDEIEFKRYSFWFQLGSIIPDLVPTFIWKRHRIDTTTNEFEKAIMKFLNGKQSGRLYSIRLGIITHYLSDYFTFPHNKECHMNIAEHNSYEGRQLQLLKAFTTNDISKFKYNYYNVHSFDNMIESIELLHDEYIKRIEEVRDKLLLDLEYIGYVNFMILQLLLYRRIELLSQPILVENHVRYVS